jgi:hypothetical protein
MKDFPNKTFHAQPRELYELGQTKLKYNIGPPVASSNPGKFSLLEYFLHRKIRVRLIEGNGKISSS